MLTEYEQLILAVIYAAQKVIAPFRDGLLPNETELKHLDDALAALDKGKNK